MPSHSQYVAMDCEMVGTLTGQSACARVVLVDWKGRAVLDAYVKPTEVVTDYRTFVSGITADDLEKGQSLVAVRVKVQRLLQGKILVGHGLKNDLECLGISHPWYLIRDTAYYEPFMKIHYGTLAPRRLKDLALEKLQMDIQDDTKPHSPSEDATAALDLYKCHRPRWEACIHAKMRESQRMTRHQVMPAQLDLRQQHLLQQQQPLHYPAMPHSLSF
jgi:RNA exonuclease 4